MLLLHQDRLIERIDADLRPGIRPGQSELNLNITEARPYQIGFETANNRSPSIGGISGKFWITHRNLTGFGDALYFNYGRTDGLDDYFGSYSLPLNAYETRLNLYYQNSQSDIIEDPFKLLEIRSESETFGVSLSQPLYRTPSQTFSMTLAFEHRRSKTFLGEEPFSFSLGVPDEGDNKGESKISVLRLSQDWLNRGKNQVIAFRSTFNIGIDTLDSTINEAGPDSRFFFWLGQFQWIKRLPLWNSQILFRSDLQLASDPLLPMEKLSIGGLTSVRGYRENQLVRDNGLFTSLEWRVPVFRLPIPGLSKSISDGQVQLALFYDFGWSENNDSPSPDPRTTSSVGLGIHWDPSPKFHSEFYWGIPFRKIKEGSEHDIQDSGIHFLVRAEIF